jgi:hypothetical protein
MNVRPSEGSHELLILVERLLRPGCFGFQVGEQIAAHAAGQRLRRHLHSCVAGVGQCRPFPSKYVPQDDALLRIKRPRTVGNRAVWGVASRSLSPETGVSQGFNENQGLSDALQASRAGKFYTVILSPSTDSGLFTRFAEHIISASQGNVLTIAPIY